MTEHQRSHLKWLWGGSIPGAHLENDEPVFEPKCGFSPPIFKFRNMQLAALQQSTNVGQVSSADITPALGPISRDTSIGSWDWRYMCVLVCPCSMCLPPCGTHVSTSVWNASISFSIPSFSQVLCLHVGHGHKLCLSMWGGGCNSWTESYSSPCKAISIISHLLILGNYRYWLIIAKRKLNFQVFHCKAQHPRKD